ncbi:hypothetical protein TNCV_1083121 [Trichonephila clavipes]|nr:hypothetical protein TNCV_1083121 [Trichonephila clavipes]
MNKSGQTMPLSFPYAAGCQSGIRRVHSLRIMGRPTKEHKQRKEKETATAGSDVVQSGRPIFDDFFQHLWPYIGNNTANVVFQLIKRLWLIRIDQ